MTDAATRHASRARSPELTDRILAAAERALRFDGFTGLKVEHVAASVGCSKTAIYRRWATKEELAAAVLLKDADLGTLPDTGTLAGDLAIHMRQSGTYRRFETPVDGPRNLWALLVEPDVRRIVDSAFLSDRREQGRTIVARAVQRGEIPPETDADMILDMIAGFSFYRSAIRDQELTETDMRQIAESVAASPPLRVHQ
ncbi:TetR/AcrR family transcriptional regulator [Saccharopolyspora elongata]|uniref:TetR/AcrR family transcriptional regulator n=1 Tax=Saccharopolyspora elongata TaxID=2530387 RepID=A0A4R4YCZ5_9PSEU|nr:TetR/AcrR family transcriptional regulator [Saccharopolyspora elongata]TDD42453.1 TetR/AcrR family transcriptional regulator [Saccharopolyspora elongata]